MPRVIRMSPRPVREADVPPDPSAVPIADPAPSRPTDDPIVLVPLTKPQHVRDAAAALFNEGRRKWRRHLSAPQVRALTQVLALARQVIFDTEVEARITRMEKRFGLLPSEEDEDEELSDPDEGSGEPPVSLS